MHSSWLGKVRDLSANGPTCMIQISNFPVQHCTIKNVGKGRELLNSILPIIAEESVLQVHQVCGVPRSPKSHVNLGYTGICAGLGMEG